MNKVKTETWNGYKIRFVFIDEEWRAVLADICNALGVDTWKAGKRLKDAPPKKGVILDNLHRQQEVLLINEIGIYKIIFRSRKPEAENFQNWVYSMLKELRKATGLEGFEVFRMLDKEHQKQAMAKLQTALHQAQKADYIKANIIADKAVSTLYGFEKMVRKSDMSPQMLSDRQSILDDTISLMALNDKYHMHISVSQTIYQQKGSQAV